MSPGDIGSFEAVITTPLPAGCKLGLKTGAGGISSLVFLPAQAIEVLPASGAASDLAWALRRYFEDASCRRYFGELALMPAGTPFQRRVWSHLSNLSPAECPSYGELARRLPSGARAVAGACRANPLPVVIPCHRVIAKSGTGGYMGQQGGWALEIKHWLLRHEGFPQ